jgi:glycosyltransferase involved in cell wall biosynthesis
MSASLRVGLVIGQLHAGGSERQLYELARGLRGGVCEPFVYCLSEHIAPFGTRLQSEGIPLRVLSRRHGLEPRRLLALARLFRADRIDVVNSFAQNSNFYACFAILLARRGVFIASNRLTDLSENAWRRRLNGLVFHRSRRIVANSVEGARFAAHRYHLPADRIEVIPNGLDPARFAAPLDPAEARRRLAIPAQAPLVGWVGRMSAEKRPDLFLETARLVAARMPEAFFVMAGGGEMMEAMRARAADLQLGSRLIFVGAVDHPEEVLAAIDLLVLTSDFEGLPNVIMEAMAASRPVVATDGGGCRELVSDRTTGLLARPGDPGDLATKTIEILQQPDRGRRMGSAGHDRVLREFTLERMIRSFEGLYQRAAGRAPRPLDGASALS